MVPGLFGLLLAQSAPVRTAEPLADRSARRFIVAFELSGERGFDFVWPHASLPRFPDPRVLMVVESMPRAMDAGAARRSVALPASRHLRINGALKQPRPGASAEAREEFLVPLQGGRLRLSFTLPEAMRVDPSRRSAVIRLYHVESEEGGSR